MTMSIVGAFYAADSGADRAPVRLRILDLVVAVGCALTAGAGFYAREITHLLTGW